MLAGCGNGSTSDAVTLPPSTMVKVHQFAYDQATKTYLVMGETVTQDAVDRDLVGSLCVHCHSDQVSQLRDSAHFKLAAKTKRVLFPGGGAHGMLDRACGLPATTGLTNYNSNVGLNECAKCHVDRYMPAMEGFFASMFGPMGVADPSGEARRLVDAGLDCMVCHAAKYKSHPTSGVLADVAGTATADATSPTRIGAARDARDDGDFNHDGKPDLVIDVNGDGTPDVPLMMDRDGDGTPETPWPTVAQDRSAEAILSMGPTSEEACLRCHEHARTGYKRGTLFLEGHDVHASATSGPFQGADNRCTVCHTAAWHKFVRGHEVGGDLAAADYPPPAPGTAPNPADPTELTCQKCHDPATLPEWIHTERHLAVMACETCHIPYSSGITYSLFGHGGHVAFARTDAGTDTKLVVADMYAADGRADVDADWEAFKSRPILTWFDGGTSFLAQSLSVRGMPNARITPFKPMANGMVFDARFFQGATLKNDAGADYNAYSMYRFFANGMNAEAFQALGMLEMSPAAVRQVTLNSFFDPDPTVQAMALMQIFPNLVYFDKADYGYEHYLTKTGSPYDQNHDGVIDAGQPFLFDMLHASNAGLAQFQAFNGPMGFPKAYSWYPTFSGVQDVISMKLPDGSLIKMFLEMQATKLPPDQQAAYLAAVASYPAYSNVTLGGHGVLPKEAALGNNCMDCHGAGGVLSHPVPVTRKVRTDMGMLGQLDLPLYRWRYYQVRALTDLGLSTSSEEVLAGAKNVDVAGNTTYLRDSATDFVLNWLVPNAPGGYRAADDPTALQGTGLTADDLTWHGGAWMPVLEPVVDMRPNYEVLGYDRSEILWN